MNKRNWVDEVLDNVSKVVRTWLEWMLHNIYNKVTNMVREEMNKLCINCVHYGIHLFASGFDLSVCKRTPDRIDLVTGKSYDTKLCCVDERYGLGSDICGTEGKYYEEKL